LTSTSTRSSLRWAVRLPDRAREGGLFLGGLLFAVAIHVWDPTATAGPTCPFYAITGRYCPGCGTLRCLHALAHGQVGAAIDHNALTVLLLPLVIAAWASVGIAALRGRPARELRLPSWAGWAIAGALALFWVLRNLSPPVFAWMAP
jgi:Protein of unknown function (DUF2752)